MKKLFLGLTLATLLTGCQSLPHRDWVRSEVYFGLSKPDGSLISAEEWQSFLDEAVTPQFPSGLSVMEARGQWRDQNGEIDREPTKVLILLHRRNAEIDDAIDAIRAKYCERFEQEAVMKVTTKARVEF